MVQIPDNVRPYIDFVVKQHFWLLMPLVPLLVLPLLFMANGSLGEQIVAARGQIDSRLSALQSVQGMQPHPNESWSEQINKRTNAVKRETLAEWQKFWESQQPLRVWPAALGDDFVQRAAALKSDGKLPRKLLERYQNGVRALVRQLPARMGADEVMVDPVAPAASPGGSLQQARHLEPRRSEADLHVVRLGEAAIDDAGGARPGRALGLWIALRFDCAREQGCGRPLQLADSTRAAAGDRLCGGGRRSGRFARWPHPRLGRARGGRHADG
jgi:hypothetical protein